MDLAVRAAIQAPSADNTQPLRYKWDGQYLSIFYDARRVAGRTFGPDHPATLLSVGCVAENLKQLMSNLNFEFQYEINEITGTSGDEPYFRCVIPVGFLEDGSQTGIQSIPLFNRHTNRLPYSREPLDLKHILTGIVTEEGGAGVRLFDTQSGRKQVADLIQQASEVRFQTPEVHEWLANSLRFTSQDVASGDGLDIATLDLPPGGRSFMRLISSWPRMATLNKLFGMYRLLALIEARPIRLSPAIIGIVGPSDARGAFNAGLLLARLWIHLNKKGFAVQPYFVVSDQLIRREEGLIPPLLMRQTNLIQEKVVSLFKVPENQQLYMILRIGLPKKQPVRSKRLPISCLFERANEK